MKQAERAIYFAVIILLTVLNISQTNRAEKRFTSTISSLTSLNKSANYIRKLEVVSSDLPISRRDLLVSESGDTISYDSICKIPKMVLFINENICAPCIDSIYKAADNVFSSMSYGLIIVRSDIRTGVDINNHTRNFDTYFRTNQTKGIPIMESELPFFFLLDDDCLTKALFIPDKTSSKSTLWYLKQMKERLST